MKLVGLMLARNEEWVIRCSVKVALKWCDEVVVIDDDSTDRTAKIAEDAGAYVVTVRRSGEFWDEMHLRQKSLEIGRIRGGTHFAVIDADEVLTAADIPKAWGWFKDLAPGECLDVPMIACWKSLDHWNLLIQSWLTLGFMDAPGLCWKPRGSENYHHHARPPHGTVRHRQAPSAIGVFHLQFAAWDRFIWKHRHYMMTERARWGYAPKELNEKYHWFERGLVEVKNVPAEWWAGLPKELVNLEHVPWYRSEVLRMFAAYPAGTFKGLDLFGMEAP